MFSFMRPLPSIKHHLSYLCVIFVYLYLSVLSQKDSAMISTTASAVNDDDNAPFTFETMMVNWHSFLQTGSYRDDESDDDDSGDDGDDVMVMMLKMMIMIDR